jgi:subtilisin family serine protease
MQSLPKTVRVAAILFLLLNLVATIGAGPFSPQLQAGQNVEVLVMPAAGVPIEAISTRYSASLLNAIPALNTYELRLDPVWLDAMQADPAIARLALNSLAEPLEMQRRDFGSGSSYDLAPIKGTSAADPLYFRRWSLFRLRVNQALRVTSGNGVTVAIVDTGIDLDHPALAGHLMAGYDFVDDDTLPDDVADGLDNDGDGYVDEGAGHGTHVAGIVAQVAPEATLMPVRVLDSDGVGSYFDSVAGIVYAVEQGAQVINLSLSGPNDNDFLQAAVDYAWGRGTLVVAAAGAYDVLYPARYQHVLSVGATDAQDQVAEFSDFRAGQVSVFAPGVSVYSTYYDGGYAWWSGTSMAAPFVSGEAALLLAMGDCDLECVSSLVPREVHRVVPSQERRGRIDVYEAVKAAGAE